MIKKVFKKKNLKYIIPTVVIILALIIGVIVFFVFNSGEKSKDNEINKEEPLPEYIDNFEYDIKSEIKDGVLTISGEGPMPGYMIFDDLSVKKIVIEEGITSVCDNAFEGCGLAKEVILPKSLKEIGERSFAETMIQSIKIEPGIEKISIRAFEDCFYLMYMEMPGSFEVVESDDDYYNSINSGTMDVKFTTKLDLHVLKYFYDVTFELAETETEYMIKDGGVYSKDGDILYEIFESDFDFRIPNECTKVCIEALMEDAYSGGFDVNKSIIVPESVKEIITAHYQWESWRYLEIPYFVHFEGKELPENLWIVYDKMTQSKKYFLRKITFDHFECKLDEQEKFYIIDDILVSFEGKKREDVKVPEYIKHISQNAFWGHKGHIELPNGVETIGPRAFSDTEFSEMELPENLISIGDEAFAYSLVREVVFKDKVEDLGCGIFYESDVEDVVLNDKIKEIPEEMFFGSSLQDIYFENVEVIGERAFAGTQIYINGLLYSDSSVNEIKECAFEMVNTLGLNLEKEINLHKNVFALVSKYTSEYGEISKKDQVPECTITVSPENMEPEAFNIGAYPLDIYFGEKNYHYMFASIAADFVYQDEEEMTTDYRYISLKIGDVNKAFAYKVQVSRYKDFSRLSNEMILTGEDIEAVIESKQDDSYWLNSESKLYLRVRPLFLDEDGLIEGRWNTVELSHFVW